jgi:glycosyltransferase involved in cell wall biosynthesis
MATGDHTGNALIVVPAYNEEEALPGVLTSLRAELPGTQLLVVDDGSVDATAEVAAAGGARILRLPFNVGVGGALRAGLLLAQRERYDAVVQCDADGQHPVSAVSELLAGLAGADIVIGARFAGVGEYQVRGARRWAMVLLARMMSRVHHTTLTDVTSGFRAFGPAAIDVLAREMPPDYLGDTVEALVVAKEYGLRVAQVPVAMLERQGGIASHAPWRASLYLMRVALIMVLSFVRLLGARRRRSRR